ncbi:hypothetical protein Pyn_01482 [Prunus yedoensis var. nudiflora]|uniref:C3H1-type domain-containing protein n=1 Tax=Prunus yedoensis var. nudiflora TaxID=2094558 RepID=A0A314UK19_PRUYE|nr:hypothetical protein Pyn_01482 [Prunus yedoensis var. nudiflora]
MASRAQKIVDDLNITITNLGFERFDPPVLLAPTTVQFNLALGHPLVTEELEEGVTVNIFYKTRLCDEWKTSAGCSHGLGCYFAHGRAELWTKLCKNLKNPNGCLYGDICKFQRQP